MANYENLVEYQDLLKRISLHGGRTIAFVGSGLSNPAGIPTWEGLRDKIISDFINESQTRTPDEEIRIKSQCAKSKDVLSLWNAFDILSKIRTAAVFDQSIRRHISVAEKVAPPRKL